MFNNLFTGRRKHKLWFIVFADFHDVNTPIVTNFKLPKLVSTDWQDSWKSDNRLLWPGYSASSIISLVVVTSDACELKAFYSVYLSISFILICIMFFHLFLKWKSNIALLGVFFLQNQLSLFQVTATWNQECRVNPREDSSCCKVFCMPPNELRFLTVFDCRICCSFTWTWQMLI